MYLYFSSNGTLKEIINDSAIRQGNSKINKLKIFIEGAEPQTNNQGIYQLPFFSSGVRTFIDVEGNELTTESFSLVPVVETIPFNKKRELKYFKYWEKYQLLQITVPDDILNESGTVGCRVQLVTNEGEDIQATLDSDDTILTLGLIVFNVEISGGKAVIEPDTAINIAQWNYLLKKMSEVDYYTDHVLFMVDNISLATPSNFNDGQIIYDKESHLFYKVVSGEFVVEPLDIGELEINGERLVDIVNAKVDKTTLPNRIYGTTASGTQTVYHLDDIIQDINDVPNKQMTTSVIRNLQENVSGRPLTNYTFTLNQGVNYSWYHALYNGEEVTEEKARDYMEYMTGSRFLPGFDYDHPQNSYFIAADGKVYKPQFVNNSFDLYVMPIPFENIANKVNSVNSASTHIQYPSAKCLYDNIQNVLEVANGKCKTAMLSYDWTVSSVKTILNQYGTHADAYLFNAVTGEFDIDIKSAIIAGDWDSETVFNSAFNAQNNAIFYTYASGKYLIFQKKSANYSGVREYYFILKDDMYKYFNIGDIFLVIETDVPDRWFGDSYYIYKLETSKVEHPYEVVKILTANDLSKINYEVLVAPVVEEDKNVVIFVDSGLLLEGTPDGNVGIFYSSDYNQFNTLRYFCFEASGTAPTQMCISIEYDTANRVITNYDTAGSDLVTANVNQIITGQKTFQQPIIVDNTAKVTLKAYGYDGILGLDQVNTLQFSSGAFWTNVANFDLGTSSHKWRYGWINALKGTTTMTQAQYDALVSGGTVDADTFYFIEEE